MLLLFIVVKCNYNNQVLVFSFVSQCGHLWCRLWCFNCWRWLVMRHLLSRMLYCDWLVFSGCDWSISILTVSVCCTQWGSRSRNFHYLRSLIWIYFVPKQVVSGVATVFWNGGGLGMGKLDISLLFFNSVLRRSSVFTTFTGNPVNHTTLFSQLNTNITGPNPL